MVTVIDLLQRLLDGHAVPGAMVTEELGRLVVLAALLATDARLRSVRMRPRARAELREFLLLQAALRSPQPTA